MYFYASGTTKPLGVCVSLYRLLLPVFTWLWLFYCCLVRALRRNEGKHCRRVCWASDTSTAVKLSFDISWHLIPAVLLSLSYTLKWTWDIWNQIFGSLASEKLNRFILGCIETGRLFFSLLQVKFYCCKILVCPVLVMFAGRSGWYGQRTRLGCYLMMFCTTYIHECCYFSGIYWVMNKLNMGTWTLAPTVVKTVSTSWWYKRKITKVSQI